MVRPPEVWSLTLAEINGIVPLGKVLLIVLSERVPLEMV